MERIYYTINESMAVIANELNSFREYIKDSATNGYKSAVNEVYDLADRIAQEKPQNAEKAEYMALRYAKKYADYLNNYYRNEASCPSVMVCGPANFPTRKKEKQNARRDTLRKDYIYLIDYKKKIEFLLSDNAPILSSDADAIERLQDKIADLEAEKELMKAINAYYRKNKTMEGFETEIPSRLMRHITFRINNNLAEFGLFDTSNTNAEIKRLKDRLEKLQTIKEAGTTEKEYEGFTVIENTELMRLQILFDSIPSEDTRSLLKSNGFKWSPKNQAWQRQLTDNAKYAFNRIAANL